MSLYYSSNTDLTLQPATLKALRTLPDHWTIILECRPAGQGVDREFDALVITERALHVVEFKYRSQSVTIQTESSWFAGQERMMSSKGESPKEQVTATADAFGRWLKQHLPTLHTKISKRALFPWVILERHDPYNTMNMKPLREGWYETLGHVCVASGTRNLQEMIERREERLDTRIDEASHQVIRDKLDAKPFERMIVQGKVIFLGDGKSLANIPVTLKLEGTKEASQPSSVKTSGNGIFEFSDLPLARFTLDLSAPQGWRILPTASYAPGGVVLTPIYVSTTDTNPEELKTLIEAELVRFKREAEAQQKAATQKLGELEKKLNEATQHVEFLYQHAETNEAKLDTVLAEIQSLREERASLGVFQSLPLEDILQKSLAPLRAEVRQLGERVTKLEGESEQTKKVAAKASQQAAEASRHAEKAKLVNEDYLAFESTKLGLQEREEELRLEIDAKRSLAMGWSVAIGGAGALIAFQPLPFADNLILTPLQIALVIGIGRLYGHTLTQQVVLKVFSAVGMGFLAQNVTIAAYKFIPGAFFLGGVTVPAFTILLGYLSTLYFERGKTFTPYQQLKQLKRIGGLLSKPEHLNELRKQGSSLFEKVKEKNFNIKPEEFQKDMKTLRDMESGLVKKLLAALFSPSESDK